MEETLKQKKIALAQSEHASVIIEIIKDCLPQTPLVAGTEWQTIVNAVTLEAHSTLMLQVTDYINQIRQGILHEENK